MYNSILCSNFDIMMDINKLEKIVDPLQQMFVEDKEVGINFALAINDMLYNAEREPNLDALESGEFLPY